MFTNASSIARRAIVCAGLAAGIIGAPALASAEPDYERHIVRYSHGDLAGESQVAALYGRLQAASRDVCSSLRGRDVTSFKAYRACYSTALADAVSAVNQQMLTSLHNDSVPKAARTPSRSTSQRG